jgi:outer membrane protein OmpA-like peptidoglycan-associated protein
VQELGKALSDTSMKGSTFVLAGHTDAIGGEAYNQDLSERRADTIKKYLVEHYGLNGSDLVTVGYGKTRPKDPNAPMDPTNRRVQVVNMDTKTAQQ